MSPDVLPVNNAAEGLGALATIDSIDTTPNNTFCINLTYQREAPEQAGIPVPLVLMGSRFWPGRNRRGAVGVIQPWERSQATNGEGDHQAESDDAPVRECRGPLHFPEVFELMSSR